MKGVGKVCQTCGPTPGLSIVPWGIERNPYGSCRKSWRRIVVRVLTNPPRKGLVSSCGTYTGQQNSENCWVSPACLTSESHLAQGHLLKLPASGDRVRQGYRGTAIWPGEGQSHHQYSPESSWVHLLSLHRSSIAFSAQPASAHFLSQVLILNEYRAP